MLSLASHSLSRASSMSSVGSDDSIACGEASSVLSGDIPPTGAVKRTRKRFTSTQLTILEHLYHRASHPTREEREQLAKEAEIDIRSVTVWFQNKRQTDRRMHRQLSEPSLPLMTSSPAPLPPSSPFSDASGNTIHTVRARTRTLSGNSISSFSAMSAASTSTFSTAGRKRERDDRPDPTDMSRHVRRRSSAAISLDLIAARSERPALLPRTPPQCIAASPSSASSSPARPVTPELQKTRGAPGIGGGGGDEGKERALWENMQSSPAAPDPTIRPEKDVVMYSRRFTLEYACAREMVGGREREREQERSRTPGEPRRHKERQRERKKHGHRGHRRAVDGGAKKTVTGGLSQSSWKQETRRGEDGDENEVPVAEWDTQGDTDTEGALTEAPITPSSSFGFSELSVVDKSQHTEKNRKMKEELETMDVAVARRGRDEDMMNAAYVLFNLSQRG